MEESKLQNMLEKNTKFFVLIKRTEKDLIFAANLKSFAIWK